MGAAHVAEKVASQFKDRRGAHGATDRFDGSFSWFRWDRDKNAPKEDKKKPHRAPPSSRPASALANEASASAVRVGTPVSRRSSRSRVVPIPTWSWADPGSPRVLRPQSAAASTSRRGNFTPSLWAELTPKEHPSRWHVRQGLQPDKPVRPPFSIPEDTLKTKASMVQRTLHASKIAREAAGGDGKSGEPNMDPKAAKAESKVSKPRERVQVPWQSPLVNAPFEFKKARKVPPARAK